MLWGIFVSMMLSINSLSYIIKWVLYWIYNIVSITTSDAYLWLYQLFVHRCIHMYVRNIYSWSSGSSLGCRFRPGNFLSCLKLLPGEEHSHPCLLCLMFGSLIISRIISRLYQSSRNVCTKSPDCIQDFISVFLWHWQLRCTYRAYDAMDEIAAAYSIAFNNSGSRQVSTLSNRLFVRILWLGFWADSSE